MEEKNILKITQPQFLFIIHQLLNNPDKQIYNIAQDGNQIVAELVKGKVWIFHEYDDNGKNHVYFRNSTVQLQCKKFLFLPKCFSL